MSNNELIFSAAFMIGYYDDNLEDAKLFIDKFEKSEGLKPGDVIKETIDVINHCNNDDYLQGRNEY